MTKSATRIQDKDTQKRLSVVQSTADPSKYWIVILNPDGSRISWPKGDPWDAATITVWSTTTGEPWTSASVTNSGTSSAVVLEFTIPEWEQGEQWETGNGISSVTSSKSGKITTVTINFTDAWVSPYSFQISDGEDGQGAWDVLWPSSSVDGDIVLFDGATWKLIKDSWSKISDIKTKWVEVTVNTASGTVAKVGTTTAGNYTPTSWDFLLVNFVNGCSVDSPTLDVDSSGAKNICTWSANANKSTFALWTTANSNIKVLLYYDWTYYRCWSTSNTNTTYSAMSVNEWQTGTATSARTMRADYLKQIIKYHAVSDTAYWSWWDGQTDIAPSQNAVYDKISLIDEVIPSAATSSNQLADKDYVNDSINSVTAYYITKNANGDQFATYSELSNATTFYSGWVVRVPTRNDYTIVVADENHDNATTRYIYQGGWQFQYVVNETALTTAQLDALNSWITSGKVSTYDGYATTIAWKVWWPASSVDWHIVLFDGITWKLVKDSWVGLSSKQDALSTQTAYTSQWSATVVPVISTNSLWQVTSIVPTNITFPVTSVGGSTGAVWLKTINNTSIVGSGNITALTSETVVSGDSGTTYTIKVSNSAPASWTPNTTITFVTD